MANAESNLSKEKQVVKPPLQADYTWYNSMFTQLLAPLVATRYLWLAVEDLNPLDFLDKKASLLKKGENLSGPAWKEPSFGRYASRNFAAFGMGATFLTIMSLYSKNTLNDIKAVYAEAVGYELGKKTEDVTTGDIFLKSKNQAITTTCKAYLTRTTLRLATAAAFFIPWHKLSPFKTLKPKYDANANAGVGAVGAYLYGDGFLREPSFFDIEQKLVSTKINHKDVNPYVSIQPEDVQALLVLQRKHRSSHYKKPQGSSPEGTNDIILSRRIADLLNQTYQNSTNPGDAHLTIGKFNYLIGFGLLDHFPESLAFVEMANRSSDMQDVKQAAKAIRAGQNPKTVFEQAGISLGAAPEKMAPPPITAIEPTETHGYSAAQKITRKMPPQPQTHMDFAAQAAANQLGV